MIDLNDTSLLSISCNKLLYSFDFFLGGGVNEICAYMYFIF